MKKQENMSEDNLIVNYFAEKRLLLKNLV
jgi:hypothetical protein